MTKIRDYNMNGTIILGVDYCQGGDFVIGKAVDAVKEMPKETDSRILTAFTLLNMWDIVT